jgi:hypothetical protein
VLRRLTLLVLALTLLAVDPAGAATGTVDPATDLVDGQVVRLVVDGLPAQAGGTWVEILQCRTPLVDRATDCPPYGTYRHVNPQGLLRGRVQVRSRLLVAGGHHDCRGDSCAFVVFADVDPVAEVPLDLDPAGPIPDPPDITADPTAGLVDGQRITVHGEGLFPFDDVRLAFCPVGGAEADCLHLPGGTFGDETGAFAAPVSAWAVLRPRRGVVTDCRSTACVLRATVNYGAAAPFELPLDFLPDGDLLVPRVGVAPHADLGPRQSVTVRLSGFHQFDQDVPVMQCLGRPGTPPDLRRCDRAHGEQLRGRDGWVRISLRRTMHTARGDVDCDVRRCRIWIGRTIEAPALASGVLVFRPRR